jgi:hypothetical protein
MKRCSLLRRTKHDLVPLPREVKLVGYKWVFKKKQGIPGVEPIRFKARLMVKGYPQNEGIDYHEVFSLIVKYKTIRVLLATVSTLDLELEQLDVRLHSYMEI